MNFISLCLSREPYTLDNIENRRAPPPWTPRVRKKIFLLKQNSFVFFQTIMSCETTSQDLRLSELEQQERVLLLSTPPETFRGFSYINPNV